MLKGLTKYMHIYLKSTKEQNMKKTSNFPKFVLAALSCFSFMLSGCNNNSSNNDNVTIILSKKSTTLVVGAPDGGLCPE